MRLKKKFSAEEIFRLTWRFDLKIRSAAEVGVYSFETSILRPFIEAGLNCDLYEAIPSYAKKIEADVKNFPETELINCAVSDYCGEMDLCIAGPSTFNSSQALSPALVNDGLIKAEVDKVTVKCQDFQQLDRGNYDFLSIDTEGGEYSVLSRMKSRPAVINLETHGKRYVNPRIGSIGDWMLENGYKIWFVSGTDTAFIKGDRLSLGLVEDFRAYQHNKRYFCGRLL